MTKTQARPPIVTILGHVDHGKTTLLDYIRKSQIASKEHGGITQKIGAYEITTDIKGYNTNKITFIDTPGHEAFSKLRARGANVADIAILIIDAKDSVMPQTVESISHIQSAKIPFIVVLNKTDLSDANPEKVKNDLMKHQVQVEGKGGGVPVINISAKTGKGIPDLLETILLMGADLNLNYAKQNIPEAIIIETKKDKRGVVVSSIIKNGQLKVGDDVYVDNLKTRIRSMFDDQGKSIKEVFPSKPFELLGFSELPEVGSVITLQSEFTKQPAKEIPIKNPTIPQKISLESILNPVKKEEKLSLIIKADSQGSLEAISNSLINNKNVEIILQAVGDVFKSDVFLAKTTKSVIIGFSVAVSDEVRQSAKQEKIIIKTYDVIYHLLDELNEVARLIKEKQQQEKNLKGEAKVLATFVIEGEKIYGVKITKGKLNIADELEVYHNNKLLGKTKLISLKIRAKTVSVAKKDQEAGMIFNPLLDITMGDVIKSIL